MINQDIHGSWEWRGVAPSILEPGGNKNPPSLDSQPWADCIITNGRHIYRILAGPQRVSKTSGMPRRFDVDLMVSQLSRNAGGVFFVGEVMWWFSWRDFFLWKRTTPALVCKWTYHIHANFRKKLRCHPATLEAAHRWGAKELRLIHSMKLT